jgi:branched-chain amino acid transport system ATP-binding protein
MFLEVNSINVFYGDAQCLWNVTFNVPEKRIVTIIGANGAGKTTTLRAISGLLHPRSGSIRFLGQDIHRLPPHKIVKLGISHVPEGRHLFPYLTTYENLMLGAYTPTAKEKREESLEMVYQLFPILKERKNQLAGTLSGGEQQMLAIGRGLMSRPKLLMLDEPSLGLAPKLVQLIFDRLEAIRKEGITILLVEQNVYQALSLADKAYVLETGHIVLEGKGLELLENENIKKAYMGL